jgi:hypothetical protein
MMVWCAPEEVNVRTRNLCVQHFVASGCVCAQTFTSHLTCFESSTTSNNTSRYSSSTVSHLQACGCLQLLAQPTSRTHTPNSNRLHLSPHCNRSHTAPAAHGTGGVNPTIDTCLILCCSNSNCVPLLRFQSPTTITLAYMYIPCRSCSRMWTRALDRLHTSVGQPHGPAKALQPYAQRSAGRCAAGPDRAL